MGKKDGSTLSDTRIEGNSESYLVDRLVMGGSMANVVLAAFTGTGKTTLCLGMAICMAQGKPVWGKLHVPKPLKVVFIDQEGVVSQIIEVINKMSDVYGKPEPKMVTLLTGKTHSYSIFLQASLDSLASRLSDIRPGFVFLDGWQWFVDGKTNDSEAVSRALNWWRSIRMELGFGLCIVHHTKKMGDPRLRPRDMLEMSSGVHTLMDQAKTKLIYEHLPGYEDFGYLHGRCSRADWNPVKMVLEYDATTQSHRLVDREGVEDMLDAKALEFVWGEHPMMRKAKSLFTWLNNHGLKDADIARELEVSMVYVYKLKHGIKTLNRERFRQLEELKRRTER